MTAPEAIGGRHGGQIAAMAQPIELTFDDGPDGRTTPAVLSALARAEVRATFFMVGERVRADPRLAAAVLAAGHQVELHCDRHVRHTAMSEAEIERDARDGLAALRGVGAAPRRWRTPWGVRTENSEAVASKLGLGLVGWDHDSHDWRGDGPREMFAAIAPGLAAGGSVLMHDGLGPGSRRASSANTVALVAAIVETFGRGTIAGVPLELEAA